MLASSVTSTIDFWRGAGKLIVICLLVVVMFPTLMAYLGVSFPWIWKRKTSANPLSRAHKTTASSATKRAWGVTVGAADKATETTAGATDAHEQHLDLMAQLRTRLRYQGPTVVLIVFAVLILGIDHVVDGPEVATVLSGIAGYVLGTSNTPPTTTTA